MEAVASGRTTGTPFFTAVISARIDTAISGGVRHGSSLGSPIALRVALDDGAGFDGAAGYRFAFVSRQAAMSDGYGDFV